MSRPRQRQIAPTRKPANAGKRAQQRDVGEIVHGTVGWQDGKDHFELQDEGVPLLKVTLWQGFNSETEGATPDPSRARGRPVLARFDGRESGIPNDGEIVILARPAGLADRVGNPAIGSYFVIGRPMPTPKWIPNQRSDEKILFGPKDSFIRIKTDGSIVGFVKSGDDPDTGKPSQFELSADGFRVNHPHGEAYCDVDGFGMSHSSGAAFSGGAIAGLPAPLDAFSSFINVRAATVRLNAQALVLGPQAGQDNLLRATPTLSTLDTIQGEIAALQAAIIATNALAAAATPNPPGTAFAAALAAATTALATLATTVTAGAAGIAACHTYGPTQSCTGS